MTQLNLVLNNFGRNFLERQTRLKRKKNFKKHKKKDPSGEMDMDMWKDGSLERIKFNQLNANKRWNITNPITLQSWSQGKKTWHHLEIIRKEIE